MNGGGTIGYTTGDTLRLLDDAQLIKPNFMAGVPRVWNRYARLPLNVKQGIDDVRINAAIKTQLAAGGLKGALLKKAVDAKLHNWRTTGEVTHKLYDVLVFRKVHPFPYQSKGSLTIRSEICSVEMLNTFHPVLLLLLLRCTRSLRSVSLARLFRVTE
jgi:hypothetical protein